MDNSYQANAASEFTSTTISVGDNDLKSAYRTAQGGTNASRAFVHQYDPTTEPPQMAKYVEYRYRPLQTVSNHLEIMLPAKNQAASEFTCVYETFAMTTDPLTGLSCQMPLSVSLQIRAPKMAELSDAALQSATFEMLRYLRSTDGQEWLFGRLRRGLLNGILE